MAIRDQQNQRMFLHEHLREQTLAGSSVVLVGQRVGHHTDHLLPGGLAGGGEVLAEMGGQDDDEDVTQELGVEAEEAISPVLPLASLPTIAPPRCSCVDTSFRGINRKTRNAFITALCTAPSSWHNLHLWWSPGQLNGLDRLPQHLPLPAMQCPPSASPGFILSFHFPTHPCFLRAQMPSF